MKRTIPKSTYITLVILALFASLYFEYISAHDMAVDYETRIDAQWNHNRNTLSQYNLKIQEAVQVPDIYRGDFIKTIQASMTGRYGQQGSKATMQWFQEHAIELPHQLYLQLQQMIEAGRNEFQNEQKKLLDLTRSYKRVTGTVWTGFMMNVAGFPSKEFSWSKYEILVEEQTQQQFSEKKAKAIKL